MHLQQVLEADLNNDGLASFSISRSTFTSSKTNVAIRGGSVNNLYRPEVFLHFPYKLTSSPRERSRKLLQRFQSEDVVLFGSLINPRRPSRKRGTSLIRTIHFDLGEIYPGVEEVETVSRTCNNKRIFNIRKMSSTRSSKTGGQRKKKKEKKVDRSRKRFVSRSLKIDAEF